jgi:hypothetical protein
MALHDLANDVAIWRNIASQLSEELLGLPSTTVAVN